MGEHPKAADTLGVNVLSVRYINVTLAGMVAGFGGAWFTLGSVGRFDEAMTGGRGFIGLAAMIFGKWRPFQAMLACLLFAFAEAIQSRLQGVPLPIVGVVPVQLIQSIPYILTVVLLAGFVGKAVAPKAIGEPFIKEHK
mgnify:CR=1 FL=1